MLFPVKILAFSPFIKDMYVFSTYFSCNILSTLFIIMDKIIYIVIKNWISDLWFSFRRLKPERPMLLIVELSEAKPIKSTFFHGSRNFYRNKNLNVLKKSDNSIPWKKKNYTSMYACMHVCMYTCMQVKTAKISINLNYQCKYARILNQFLLKIFCLLTIA